MPSSLHVVIFFLVAALAAPCARADDGDREHVKALFAQATTQYNLGNFSSALPLFTRAYELHPDAVFLFNIAQCYRQLGKFSEAAREYRAYLREAPDAPNREDVKQRIADMDKAMAEQQAAKPPMGVQPPATAGANLSPPTPTPAPTEGRPSRTGLWIGLGVGAAVVVVAAVVLGIVFGVQTHPNAPQTSLGNFGVF